MESRNAQLPYSQYLYLAAYPQTSLQASGKELVLVSRLTVFVWSVWMGGLLAILNAANVNVYWLGIWTGVVSSGAALVSCYC